MVKHLQILCCVLVLVILIAGCSQPEPVDLPPVEPVTVIFDDDGSPDGTTALLYLLNVPQVNLAAVSISYGEAYPEVYIQHIGRVLDGFGITGIPLGYGQDHPLAGNNAFPESVRDASNGFWGLNLPNADKTYPAFPAPELFVSVLNQSAEPITILASGALTNVAQALRLDPGIKEKISGIYIMGGAIHVPGNIQGLQPESANSSAEWNIFADPQAASEVFTAGIPLYLVPLDATNQVTITRKDIRDWSDGGPAADLAEDIYTMTFDRWGMQETDIWDLMTAAVMLNPSLCGYQPMHLEVITEPGDLNGQTAVVADGEPNVQVCLEPDAEMIKATLTEVFSTGGQ
jgi:purine nucleosidase/pyrimidine-specific ribonucleoside hydrolase